MKTILVSQIVRTLLPILAGAVGAYLLTEFPVVHHAFCSGGA